MHVSQGVQLGLGVRRAQFDVRMLDVGPVAQHLRLGVLLLLRMIRIAPKGSKLLLCRRDRMRTDRVSPTVSVVFRPTRTSRSSRC